MIEIYDDPVDDWKNIYEIAEHNLGAALSAAYERGYNAGLGDAEAHQRVGRPIPKPKHFFEKLH